MDRRTYLSATVSAVALAGCASDTDGGTSGIEFSITPMSSAEDLPLAHSATMAGGGYSDSESPICVQVELTNTSEETLAYGDSRDALFQLVTSENGTFSLYPDIQDDRETEPYEFDGGCWQWTRPYGTTTEYRTDELEADETRQNTLLLAVTADETCPDTAPEEIAFRTGFRVWDPEQAGSEEKEREWGFSLTRT